MIFISYSHKDESIILPIAESFRKVFGDKKIFFDQWSIQPGDSIIEKMNNGLSTCKTFFFFISKNSLSSKMVSLEWQNALMRSTKKKEIKFIPVKIDDCLIPTILMQNLYINLYESGLDNAIRQMIDVASGKKTYNLGGINGFQNVNAYVSGSNKKMIIEFRAEAYTEPHSKYLILHENDIDELSCSSEQGLYESGHQKDVDLSTGDKFNAITISRSEATSPNFPFIVELSTKTKNPILFKGAMRANTFNTYITIPSNYLDSYKNDEE